VYTFDSGACGVDAATGYQTRTVSGELPPGTTTSFTLRDGVQLAVAATVEPDADGDGLGDETQDPCPDFASSAAACPDVRRPKTKITKSAPRRIRKDAVKLEFKSDEPRSRFQCRLDNARWERCRSPEVVKVDPGRHEFEVRAVDRAGNKDKTPARDRFRVLG
jgi:hypothetical protein